MTRFRRFNKGPLRVWENAKPGVPYIAGIDSGEGVGQEDSVCDIYRRDNGFQVCQYVTNQQDPEEFSLNCVTLLNYYNQAFVVPEFNNTSGGNLLTILKIHYRKGRVYKERVIDKVKGQKRLQYGWRTKTNNRGLLICSLKMGIKAGFIKIRSQKTLDQLKTFVRVSPTRMEHAVGEKDDCVFAAGLAWAGFKDVLPEVVKKQVIKEHKGITMKEFENICRKHQKRQLMNSYQDYRIGGDDKIEELSIMV